MRRIEKSLRTTDLQIRRETTTFLVHCVKIFLGERSIFESLSVGYDGVTHFLEHSVK